MHKKTNLRYVLYHVKKIRRNKLAIYGAFETKRKTLFDKTYNVNGDTKLAGLQLAVKRSVFFYTERSKSWPDDCPHQTTPLCFTEKRFSSSSLNLPFSCSYYSTKVLITQLQLQGMTIPKTLLHMFHKLVITSY